jgi:hypothetical protein
MSISSGYAGALRPSRHSWPPIRQARWPALDIGSYPYYRMGGGGVALVAKGAEVADVEAAAHDITTLLRAMGAKPVPGEPPA